MELSLIPNQKRLTFYIERLIYGVIVAMPLQPMVGDVLLWLAIGLALYDLISSKSLSLPTGYLSWTVMILLSGLVYHRSCHQTGTGLFKVGSTKL